MNPKKSKPTTPAIEINLSGSSLLSASTTKNVKIPPKMARPMMAFISKLTVGCDSKKSFAPSKIVRREKCLVLIQEIEIFKISPIYQF